MGETKTDKPYVPPMGDLSACLKTPVAPLMLTNGSAAPGAASAQARALSNPQQAGGLRVRKKFNRDIQDLIANAFFRNLAHRFSAEN